MMPSMVKVFLLLLSFVFDSPVVVVVVSGSSTCDGAMPMMISRGRNDFLCVGKKEALFGREFPP